MLKGFITSQNVYYEAMSRLNDVDIEVPLRRPQSSAPPMITTTQPPPPPPYWNYPPQNNMASNNTPREDRGLFGNVGWKDVITFIYFLSGVAALWINMSERTLIIEQRLNSIEKEISTNRENIKDGHGRVDGQIRAAEKAISELRYDMLKNGNHRKE